jgi:hypothetical protein
MMLSRIRDVQYLQRVAKTEICVPTIRSGVLYGLYIYRTEPIASNFVNEARDLSHMLATECLLVLKGTCRSSRCS